MRKNLFIGLLIVLFVGLFSCNDINNYLNNMNGTQTNPTNTTTNTEPEDSPTNTEIPSIPKEYWGTWLQMNTEDEYYLDASNVYKSSGSNKKYQTIASGISGYALESENILKNGNTVYFRKGGSARDFSVKIAGFEDQLAEFSNSYSSRAVNTGKQGITGRRENKDNKADNESVKSGSDGGITFTNAVAGDVQNITVMDTTVAVAPEYNGENMGTIPIVEENMFGFKTTYTIDGDSEGFCYGNYYKTYNLTLNIKNIGSIACKPSSYVIECEDSNLQIIPVDSTYAFSSFASGKSKPVLLQVRYGNLEDEYKDVTIFISITDNYYGRTWKDSVTIRFYKGLVGLKVNAFNPDRKANAKLNGFIIYPDGRSKRFSVSHSKTETVFIPWSESDYHLAFSGASSGNETAMKYSFGFRGKTDLRDLENWNNVNEWTSYEPNNSLEEAHRVDNFTSPVTAYLEGDDIDFYTINCGSINTDFIPVSYVGYAVKEYENGNKDKKVNPGEGLYLDVKSYNNGLSAFLNVSVLLSTTSNYVTIVRNTGTMGNIYANEYHSLTDYDDTESGCSLMAGDYFGNAFKFSVASNCPSGTVLPFTLTFADSSGNSWTDNFSITVQ